MSGDDSYLGLYWPMLRQTLDSLLTTPPNALKPISYEQMYSAVYKCVCRQFSEQLYNDILELIRQHLSRWSETLSQTNDRQFVEQFHQILGQYLFALASIVPIFTYLNRFYVETKLNTALRTELLKLFSEFVSDPYIDRLMSLLMQAQKIPFSIAPSVMHSLAQNLQSLDPKYVALNEPLFARYLTGIRLPMLEDDLDAQIEADKRLQEQLRRDPRFAAADQGKKRLFHDSNLEGGT